MLQGGLRPCVVILDVRMPVMDGWEVWDRMRAHAELARTPVVLLSADAIDGARAKRVGIRDFLRKPIDGWRLVAAVEKYCEQMLDALG
jgi:CheY-like chemotaxis protein